MRGISFPFRIGIKGGVVMSEDTATSYPHLLESIRQVVLTSVGERPMLPLFGSDIDVSVFEPDSQSSKTMIKFQVEEALKTHLSNQITVKGVSIYSEGASIYVSVSYSPVKVLGTEENLVEVIEVGEHEQDS